MINAATLGVPDAPLYYAMAREHVDDRNLWDDCVQEAAIRVWQLRSRGEHHSAGYYHRAARRRITDVAHRRRPWFGERGQQGRPVDPIRQPHDSLDAMRETTQQPEAR